MRWLPGVLLALLLSLRVACAAPSARSTLLVPPALEQCTDALGVAAAGRWAEAATRLRRVADRGLGGATFWYDLGRASQELGDLARARAYLERCRLMAPRDPRYAAGIERLDSALRERSLEPLGVWKDAGGRWAGVATLREWGSLELLGWLACLGGIAASWRRSLPGGPLVALLGATVALVCCLALWLHPLWKASRVASVVATSARLLATPRRDAAASTEVRGGERVTILDQEGHWCLVETPARLVGWVREDEVERFVSESRGATSAHSEAQVKPRAGAAEPPR